MYRIIAGISAIIRQVYLPNPFADLQWGVLINFLVEPILYRCTYLIVGLFYNRGEWPVLGSILYLFFYVLHIGLLKLWNIAGISIWTGSIFFISIY
ncbi:MAG: hypothetical protein FH751_07465 [Firmicutes bacterium]|nr:hypothetical protein [Bacillota bacterium]